VRRKTEVEEAVEGQQKDGGVRGNEVRSATPLAAYRQWHG